MRAPARDAEVGALIDERDSVAQHHAHVGQPVTLDSPQQCGDAAGMHVQGDDVGRGVSSACARVLSPIPHPTSSTTSARLPNTSDVSSGGPDASNDHRPAKVLNASWCALLRRPRRAWYVRTLGGGRLVRRRGLRQAHSKLNRRRPRGLPARRRCARAPCSCQHSRARRAHRRKG